jgi:hypothetical protein
VSVDCFKDVCRSLGSSFPTTVQNKNIQSYNHLIKERKASRAELEL